MPVANPIASIVESPNTNVISEVTATIKSEREDYILGDPNAEFNSSMYVELCKIYETDRDLPPLTKWEMHYKSRLGTLSDDELFYEYSAVRGRQKEYPELEAERRHIVEEIGTRCSVGSLADYTLEQVSNDSGENTKHLKVRIPNSDDYISISLSSTRPAEHFEEPGSKLEPIRIPNLYIIKEEEGWKKVYAEIPERLEMGDTAVAILETIIRAQGYDEIKQSDYLKYLDVGVVVEAIKKAYGYQNDHTTDFDVEDRLPRELSGFTNARTISDIENNEAFQISYISDVGIELSKIIGDYLGKLATRTARYPDSPESLMRLIEISRIPDVYKALRDHTTYEALFWDKDRLDPMEDLAKLFLYRYYTKGRNLQETILLRQVVGNLRTDLVKGHVSTSNWQSLGVGRIDNVYTYDNSPTLIGGPGIYFGIAGGFRNWGSSSLDNGRYTRIILKDAPLGWTVQASSRAEVIIQAESLTFPLSKNNYKRPLLAQDFNHIINASGVTYNPFDISRFNFGTLRQAPFEYIKPVISGTMFDTFRKYIPNAELGTGDLILDDKTFKIPCVVLPRDSDPAIVNALMHHFRIANITYKD